MGHSGQVRTLADGHAERVDGTTGLSLVFRAGPLRCSLPLGEVVETMRPLTIRPLADLPPFVRGVSIMRGVPAPVIDVALLLSGQAAQISRFIAVRCALGTLAFATGDVSGIWAVGPDADSHPARLLTGASAALVDAVATFDAEPLLMLSGGGLVDPKIWAAAGLTAGAPTAGPAPTEAGIP